MQHGRSSLQAVRGEKGNLLFEKAAAPYVATLVMDNSTGCATGLRFSCMGKTDLTSIAYPATQTILNAAANSNAVSVRLFDDYQLNGTTWSELKTMIEPLPQPTQPESLGFWDEFDQITKLQVSRRAGEMAASKMALPSMFSNFTMEQGAAAVESDFPTKFPTELVEQFLAEGVEFDSSIIPHATADDFVNKQVMLGRIIGWAVATVSPFAFGAKWHEGRARPEEVACAVAENSSTVSSAPTYVTDAVNALGLTAQGCTDYTAYTNGAPKHPSWPAMHSAASSASVFLAVVLNLTASQLAEAIHLDCAVATFRSFAGVHYESDNMAGLAIGQEVLRRELPQMLHEKYGSNISAVESKLEQVIAAHDWRTASSCLNPLTVVGSSVQTPTAAPCRLRQMSLAEYGYLSIGHGI
jgi:hypothetical protein